MHSRITCCGVSVFHKKYSQSVLCLASFPGSPGTRIVHAWRAWYLFYVIKIGLKQKGIVLRVVQRTMRSTLSVYDIQPPMTRYM